MTWKVGGSWKDGGSWGDKMVGPGVTWTSWGDMEVLG